MHDRRYSLSLLAGDAGQNRLIVGYKTILMQQSGAGLPEEVFLLRG
jgi:hypothetical protein